ncbi:peroxiredoxin-like family protein [Chryseobacterium indologenes]|uniref:peroxiredoxin-like family protein n=1 Tax=Chryseobacterium indologenes TaxID=253 RepID=UPI000BFBC460|nr:peroxiredoxin-like family protein [Chryseobacterium indologenes]ATN06515.1 alkyl hydroperoxide reductase [Chryseobacterium indologenes]AYY84724.1 AhpC/TSA family protein [Chryseobacterium indologenes]QIX81610.1 AhpC/TSA family protein [Chryseobacterium indologenes]UDQ55370.1 AhpC/TSA family protein [Chryseobacterium indologenes]VFA42200.1 Putative peroxiredoxin bcp [Chryseobacterium indologenes]
MHTLATQIDQLNQDLFSQLPQEVLEAFEQSIEEIKTKNIEEISIRTGDLMPEFSLPNVFGRTIHSKDILKNGKMIMAFYRGSWCPYCHLELRFLQDHLSEIKAKNAVLLAISPQGPDHSLSMIEKNNLKFEVLTDHNNEFAKKLGIVFQLQDFVLSHYQNLGIRLSDFNNNEENSLPVPAVFVVDENKMVTYKFLDVNYMNRLNVEELIQAL